MDLKDKKHHEGETLDGFSLVLGLFWSHPIGKE